MPHKSDLPSYFLPLGAPVMALGVVAGIAYLTERAVGPAPAIVAEPAGALVTAEAARSQLIRERIDEPKIVAEPANAVESASAAEPHILAGPASAAEPQIVAEPANVAEPPTTAEPASVAEPPTVAEPARVAEPSNVVAVATPSDAAAASDVSLLHPRAVPVGAPAPKPRLAAKTRERGGKPMDRSQAALAPQSAPLDKVGHKVSAARSQIRPYAAERRESSVAAPIASEASPPKPRVTGKRPSTAKPKVAGQTRARPLQPTEPLHATPPPPPAPPARVPRS